MKNRLWKHKFKNTLVKPLYRKVKIRHRPITYKNSPDGYEFHVKREISGGNANVNLNRRKQEPFLPGTCDVITSKTVINNVYNFRDKVRSKIMENTENPMYNSGNGNGKQDKLVQSTEFNKNFPETWLRVYPLPQKKGESICSTAFRCVACQLGLASVLVLWTVAVVFAINIFEGPYEVKVAQNFEREQNQLVIDLATELRQITPVSPRWREAIERRIQEEKQLTILAVGRGVRVHPGNFWDLPGTFLFTVYVMTALGFGAPVPHTVSGRCIALLYALIAVPSHFYLMLNASTCFVTKCTLRCPLKRHLLAEDRNTTDNTIESPTCNENSEALKTSKCYSTRKKIMRCFGGLSACSCVPVAVLSYYACGSVAFGVLRDKGALDTAMFPLEFTTTGGLESVPGHVRILYGFYVEGAMALLAVVLATLRKRSNAAVNTVAQEYRLFYTV